MFTPSAFRAVGAVPLLPPLPLGDGALDTDDRAIADDADPLVQPATAASPRVPSVVRALRRETG
jgi:hypothetical protein